MKKKLKDNHFMILEMSIFYFFYFQIGGPIHD